MRGNPHRDGPLISSPVFLFPLLLRQAASAGSDMAAGRLFTFTADQGGLGRRLRRLRLCQCQYEQDRPHFSLQAVRSEAPQLLLVAEFEKDGSPGLIRTGGRPINSRMLYR
jgi:hypothetical protein